MPSAYDHRCDSCQVCPSCGGTAWCEGDRVLVIPCEHHGYCGECNLDNCRDCRRVAELEEWVAHIGPPHDLGPAKTLAEVAAEQQAHLERRRRVSGFDPLSNSYAPREKK